jgi:hypothetical protein
MSERRKITADEIAKMTPQERDAAFRSGELQSLDELPPAFRERVERKAYELHDRIARERRD